MANRGLIVVESPSKIKTIHQIVGNKYVIKATVGHIMEMPKSRLGVDVEDGFKVTLKPLRGKSNVISDLKKAAGEAGEIFLATDPDREGEAIAEHVYSILPHSKRIHRIMFNAITPSEINNALENPTTINLKRVDAQKARRAIDRLIGYLLSPEASFYMGEKNFSVGRVQSPAVGLIVEREREIANFQPVPYWLIKADYEIAKQVFTAQLKSGRVENEAEAEKIFEALKNSKDHTVRSIEKSEFSRNPMPPFITSTFQRAAFRAYHFDPKFAMEIAQTLYQGVEIRGRQVALITYMRTDSTRISKEGMDMAQKQIEKQYGEQYYQRRFYKSKKGAQDAHEAIRPAHPEITPESVKDVLTEPCFKIYSLIYKRWLASQMKPAVYDKTKATIMSDDIEMEAEGKTLKFEGYLKAYGYDLSEEEEDESESGLPPLSENDKLAMKEARCERKETMPPPRYNSGSLVEKLEKLNIGRPSTYATIVDKIRERQYVEETRPKREFKPTERGFRLYDYLKEKRPLVM
ncbi:type I DNA topoisomerase, partial [bacterium]|nr:type I DNA topoisomerase [bacterium]